MYAIMVSVSTVIRQFFLPNPFECFGEYAILINWIFEPIIHAASFGLVGALGYKRGDCPALGSFLYLMVNTSITGILHLVGLLLP